MREKTSRGGRVADIPFFRSGETLRVGTTPGNELTDSAVRAPGAARDTSLAEAAAGFGLDTLLRLTLRAQPRSGVAVLASLQDANN